MISIIFKYLTKQEILECIPSKIWQKVCIETMKQRKPTLQIIKELKGVNFFLRVFNPNFLQPIYIDDNNKIFYETYQNLELCTGRDGQLVPSFTYQVLEMMVDGNYIKFKQHYPNYTFNGIISIPQYLKPRCKFIDVYYKFIIYLQNHKYKNKSTRFGKVVKDLIQKGYKIRSEKPFYVEFTSGLRVSTDGKVFSGPINGINDPKQEIAFLKKKFYQEEFDSD